ncbi:hypothetical protein BH23ACT12_BH23ACT12_13780 [soil metagenome]
MSREVFLTGYLLLAAAAAGLELAARATGRIPTLGDAVSAINRFRAGRWMLAALWLWAGWHLFVRARWG